MSENYKPQKGDRVRVVLEGEMTGTYGPDEFTITSGDGWSNVIHRRKDSLVSVEKIEPPVEVFGPGDVVRHKDHRHLVYTLGTSGYYTHAEDYWREKGTIGYGCAGPFDSREYVKVEIG